MSNRIAAYSPSTAGIVKVIDALIDAGAPTKAAVLLRDVFHIHPHMIHKIVNREVAITAHERLLVITEKERAHDH